MHSGIEVQLRRERMPLDPPSAGRNFAPDERAGFRRQKVRAAWADANTVGILRCAHDDGVKQATTMRMKWMTCCLRCLCLFLCSMYAAVAMASEHHGQIVSGDFPVPGVTITATQGAKKFVTSSDALGNYTFADLSDGSWKFSLAMTGFAAIDQDVTIVANAPGIKWELKMLPLDQMIAQTKVIKAAPVVLAAAPTGTKADSPKPTR